MSGIEGPVGCEKEKSCCPISNDEFIALSSPKLTLISKGIPLRLPSGPWGTAKPFEGALDSETSFVSTWAITIWAKGNYSRNLQHTPNLASNSFILRLLDPTFLRRSGYSQSWCNLAHVPHLGLARSHFNFRLRHDTQEIVFSIKGTFLPSTAAEATTGWEGSSELIDVPAAWFAPPPSAADISAITSVPVHKQSHVEFVVSLYDIVSRRRQMYCGGVKTCWEKERNDEGRCWLKLANLLCVATLVVSFDYR